MAGHTRLQHSRNIPCVWSAVDPSLHGPCDAGLDCERCVFHARQRAQLGEAGTGAWKLFGQPAAAVVPGDRVYHRRHTWAMASQPGRVRVGIDRFAAQLIGRCLSVIFPTPDSHLLAGHPGAWLVDDLGPIPVRMPVSGRLAAVNPILAERPALVMSEPFGNGWLVEVVCEDAAHELAALMRGEDMLLRSIDDLLALERQRLLALHKRDARVGVTMADGGRSCWPGPTGLDPLVFRRMLLTWL